jgi:ferredoxin
MIRIIYYRDKCIGCSSCSDISPYRWKINDQDGKCNLIGASSKRNNIFILTTGNDELEECLNASESCPVNIIEVIN